MTHLFHRKKKLIGNGKRRSWDSLYLGFVKKCRFQESLSPSIEQNWKWEHYAILRGNKDEETQWKKEDPLSIGSPRNECYNYCPRYILKEGRNEALGIVHLFILHGTCFLLLVSWILGIDILCYKWVERRNGFPNRGFKSWLWVMHVLCSGCGHCRHEFVNCCSCCSLLHNRP